MLEVVVLSTIVVCVGAWGKKQPEVGILCESIFDGAVNSVKRMFTYIERRL